PDPDRLVRSMQGNLATNFARRPLQVWNFGHVVDERPACRTMWSAGMLAGDENRVKNGMRGCGDMAALAKADNPTLGQASTGLLLLICTCLLLLFAAYLGVKVIKAALDSIYHGFLSIFGFAAGGFVYGPTQTFLVRNIVDSFIAGGRMTAYTVFLGVYTLFMAKLFLEAGGQVMAVIVIAAAVEVVAISQLKRLSRSLDSGSRWVANRFALALEGGRAPASGSTGTALGMGDSRAAAAGTHGAGLVAGLTALNTVNASPVTAWVAGRTLSPLSPWARGKKHYDLSNIAMATDRVGRETWNAQSRTSWRLMARKRADAAGGIGTELGLANALDGLRHARVSDTYLPAALLDAGAETQSVNDALRALSIERAVASNNPYGFDPLQRAVGSARSVDNHFGEPNMMAFAGQAVVSANRFARHTNAPAADAVIDQDFVNTVRRHWDSDAALQQAITPAQWNAVGRDTRWFIATELAQHHKAAAQAFYDNPSDLTRARLMQSTRRIANLDHAHPDAGADPWDD
ncbi:MAG: hypothetical protein J2P18_04065, partial [Nocardia sp.]|nr:hypothetical protein [Nocardia sp.]